MIPTVKSSNSPSHQEHVPSASSARAFDESMQVFAKLGTGNKRVWPRDEELH